MKKLVFFLLVLAFLFPAIAQASSGLQDSAWPVFHGNSKLTGQSPYDTSKIQGGVKWKFQAEGQVETSPVIDKDGNIYFADQKCNLYSVGKNGKENWKFKAGEPIISKEWGGFGSCSQSSPVIDSEGTVYFLPMSGNFYAVDKNGIEKWHYPIHTFKNAWPSPAIGADGTIYVGSESYPPPETGKPQEKSAYFYAFNPDGTLKWEYEAAGSSWVNSTPSIADDGTIYTTANDCKRNCANGVFAMNPDGTLKWTFLPPNGVLEGSVVIGKEGSLYFTAKGADDPRKANFYALNSDGTLKWRFPFQNGASITPGLSDDGKIYFGDWGGIFYALDLNGKELWRVQTPSAYESLSSSPAIGSDGTIYFGTIANYFYAYTSEGKEKWKIKLNESGVGSSPAIGADGTVYFITIKGGLYAIGEDEANNSLAENVSDNSKNINKIFIIVPIVVLALALLILLIILIRRKTINLKKLIAILSGLVILLGGLAYVLFFYQGEGLKNTQNGKDGQYDFAKTKEDFKGQCPRRVYGSPDKGYYGIFEMQQIDLTSQEVEWAKKNCPDTYWVGQGEVGQPGF